MDRIKKAVDPHSLFKSLLGLICVISVFDGYLLWYFRDVVEEQNPIMWYLIHIQSGDVTLALGCKLFGTILVTLTSAWLFHRHKRLAWPVVVGLAVFQVSLLCYMLLF